MRHMTSAQGLGGRCAHGYLISSWAVDVTLNRTFLFSVLVSVQRV